ncbi:hypothetical protein FISHEDRAFT_23978, partial [Fistulina hepatica ATCC 64428]
MPTSGSPEHPIFDPEQPRTLSRYFRDLESCLAMSQITTPSEQKAFAAHYVDLATADLWTSLPEFTESHGYAEFKRAIAGLYIEVDDERRFSWEDLEALVARATLSDMCDLASLGEYYRSHITISNYLIAQSKLSADGQSRSFSSGFPADMRSEIAARLVLMAPFHDPRDAHPMSSIVKAAKFVIMG